MLQDTCRWRAKTPAGNLKCRVLPIFSWALSSSFAPMGSSLQFVGMELKNIYKHHERTARYYLPGTCSTPLTCRFFKPQGFKQPSHEKIWKIGSAKCHQICALIPLSESKTSNQFQQIPMPFVRTILFNHCG